MLYIEKVAFADHQLVSHGKKHTDLGCHCGINHIDEEEDKMKHVLSTRIRLNSHIDEGSGENCGIVCPESLTTPLIEIAHKANISASVVIASVLSIHSIIEGLTLGIQSNYRSFINLAIAIFIHKIPESLVIGITLNTVEFKLKIIMIIIYSIATPLGIIFGMAINSTISPITQGIFISICIGTFVYVAASEIIVEEFAVPKQKYKKYISLLLGIGLISILILFENY